MQNPAAMEALMKIEGFRSLNEDIKTIINKSEAVKKARKENTDKMSTAEKKELSEEEKDYKSKRKQIQEKLIKFATRIPIFMYLSDYRECCLKDVITQLEPKLFKKVTGLDTNDFELLVSLGLFNDALMNDAVYKFKRYEDSSLTYTGIDRYEDENKGGWDTVISSEDYQRLFAMQQESMLDFAAAIMPDIVPQPVVEEVTKADNVSTVIEEKPVEAGYSDIEVGTVVWHKAFGDGIVSEIYNDIIEVAFGKVKKKFQFPGAFMQGFLNLA